MNRIIHAALAGLAFLTLTGAPAPAGDAADATTVMQDDSPAPVEKLLPPAPAPHRHGFQSSITPRHPTHQRG